MGYASSREICPGNPVEDSLVGPRAPAIHADDLAVR